MRHVVAHLIIITVLIGCSEEHATGQHAVDAMVADADPMDRDRADAESPDLGPRTPAELIEGIATDEEWQLPSLVAPVQVLRTEGGVPHIYASNRSDLGRVLGFILARDRYTIMELQRRLGKGTLAAILGDVGLSADIEARLTGLSAATAQLEANLSPGMTTYLTAVAEGINGYIDAVNAGDVPPPAELSILSGVLGASGVGDLLEPWSVSDFAAMGAVIIYQTTFDSSDVQRAAAASLHPTLFEGAPNAELRRAGFLGDILGDMSPLFDYSSTGGFGRNGAIPSDVAVEAEGEMGAGERSRGSLIQLVRGLHPELARFERRLARRRGGSFGSNVWSVAGRVTNDGYTLVAGDGHLQLAVPAITYQLGLDTEVYGEDGIHQTGLLIAQLPILAVGTNGRIAWSQVNPYADSADWYSERLTLNEQGRPVRSEYQGEQRDLVRVQEVYEVADAPALGSVGRTETLDRYETFDGRKIIDIEGETLTEDGEVPEGAYVLHLLGRTVIPGDQDGDGVVSAVSLDYTGFDAGAYFDAADKAGYATDALELLEAQRGLVGGGLYTGGGDADGNIMFSSYQTFPCRDYLPRDENGRWQAGANPRRLIDGTRFGGFTIPSIGGLPDESQSADPYRCIVPFDAMPHAYNPESGFVVAANNDPAGATRNGALDDDPYYIGGPWYSTRGDTIADALESGIESGLVNVDYMATVQGLRQSRLGERFVPAILDALEQVTGTDERPDLVRARAYFAERPGVLEALMERLSEWQATGYDTPSGVKTFYDDPTEADARASVATMIFNVWLREMLAAVWGDENVRDAWTLRRSQFAILGLDRILRGRGADNPSGHSGWNPATGESVFFDDQRTDFAESSRELIVRALARSVEVLASAPTETGVGGFGTDDMSAWRWGLRHQARFEPLIASFLGGDSSFSALLNLLSITTQTLKLDTEIARNDPRFGLKWFPRGGDLWAVDAATPDRSGGDFTHGNGPVMRMVIGLKDGHVKGYNIIPGGQRNILETEHSSDQLELWLANEAYPLRFHIEDVIEGTTSREVYRPASE